MKINQLQAQQIVQASEVLAASFFNYPMFTFYFPDEKRRTRFLPWYFQKILNTAHSYGEIYTTENISGVMFILPSNHNHISL